MVALLVLWVYVALAQPGPRLPTEPYPHAISPFANVFRLHADPEILSRWTRTDFHVFMNRILDADSVNTADSFPRIWDYFMFSDLDPAFDRIAFQLTEGGDTLRTIDLHLTTGGWSTSTGNAVFVNINQVDGILSPEEAAADGDFAHELFHLIYWANGKRFRNDWDNEFLATAAEYVHGERWNAMRPQSNVYYDTSFRTNRMYSIARLFHAYLMVHFSGDPDRVEDDLLYQWIRPHRDGGVNTQMFGLAAALDSLSSAHPDRYPISEDTRDAKLGLLFHRYALARYADENVRFGGIYGFGPEVSVRSFRLFEWWDPYGEQVRTVPPFFTVGEEARGRVRTVRDFVGKKSAAPVPDMSEACRTRELGVRPWGAEIVVLRADPALPESSPPAELRVTVGTGPPLAREQRVRVGYITYAVGDSSLSGYPPLDVVETIPWNVEGDEAGFIIPEFGGGGVEGVVVVATLTPDPIPAWEPGCPDPFCSSIQAENPCADCGRSAESGRASCRRPAVPLEISYSLR